PVTLPMLDCVADRVSPEALGPALRWIAAGCAVRTLASELQEAAVHVSQLVSAVKGFTQMDAAPTPQEVDVELGLTQTLAVLRSKARAKSARVRITVEPELPRAFGVPGELNQVWS